MQVFDTAFSSISDRNFRGENVLLVWRLGKTGSSEAWFLALDLPPPRPLVTLNESFNLREIKEANPVFSKAPYTYGLLRFQRLSLWTNLLRMRLKIQNKSLSKSVDKFCTRLRRECLLVNTWELGCILTRNWSSIHWDSSTRKASYAQLLQEPCRR